MMKNFEFKGKKKQDYFEGWYTRILDLDNNINIAVIFAVTLNSDDPHAFIQVYDGVALTNTYFRYDIGLFKVVGDKIEIGSNSISPNHLTCINDSIKLEVTFSKQVQVQKYLGFQSAMTFLSKFPLQCFQEVIFMDGDFEGKCVIKDQSTDIKGSLYMEKTFGDRFPKSWIWIQGNQFPIDVNISISFGLIPIMKRTINGFFAIVQHNQKEYRFGTYNFSKFKILENIDNGLKLKIYNRKYTLYVDLNVQDPVTLVGPSDDGNMNLEVYESINSVATIRLFRKKVLLFESSGSYIGAENMYKKD